MPVDGSVYGQQRFTDPLKMAGEAVNVARGGKALEQQQVDLINTQMSSLRNRLSSLLANPNVTSKDVIKAGGEMSALGIVTPQQLATVLGSGVPSDGPQLKTWLTDHLMNISSAHEKFGAAYGHPQGFAGPGGTTVAQIPEVPGNPAVERGRIGNTLAPGQATVDTDPNSPTYNQKGVTTQGQPGAFVPSPGNGAAPNALQSAAQPRAQSGNALVDAGGAPAAEEAPAQPPLDKPTVPQSSKFTGGGQPKSQDRIRPGNFLPTDLPPGRQEAATAIGSQSGSSANTLTKANESSPDRKAMLGNLAADVKNFTAGPAADWKRVAKAYVNANVPLPENWKFDPSKIASQEAFVKQATQLASNQFQAIGGTGTDEKFGAAFKSNPNETMTNMGIEKVMALLNGNEDAIQAKTKEWQNWLQSHGPETYAKFTTAFNKDYDPRVFQFQYMTPKDRQETIQAMSKKEKAEFLGKLDNAEKQFGWIKSPGAAPAQGQQ